MASSFFTDRLQATRDSRLRLSWSLAQPHASSVIRGHERTVRQVIWYLNALPGIRRPSFSHLPSSFELLEYSYCFQEMRAR